MIIVNNRDKIEWKPDITVKDILNIMGYSYILITVNVNEVFVPKEDYETFKVPDNSDFKAFHLAHGG
jgi:thiamine biosynthesis protein ThiS